MANIKKVKNLKAAFQELIFGDGGLHDVISFGLDAATTILKLADKLDGSVYIIGAVALGFGRLTMSINQSILAAQAAGVAIPANLLKAKAAVSGFTPFLLSAFAAIATYKLVDYFEGEPERKAKKIQDEVTATEEKYEEMGKELEELSSRLGSLNKAEYHRLLYLRNQRTEIRGQIDDMKKAARDAELKAFWFYGEESEEITGAGAWQSNGYAARNTVAYLQRGEDNTRYEGMSAIEKYTTGVQALIVEFDKLALAGDDTADVEKRIADAYSKNSDKAEALIKVYEDAILAGDELTDEEWQAYYALVSTAQAYERTGGKANYFKSTLNNLGAVTEDNIDLQDLLGSAIVRIGNEYYFVTEAAKESALASLRIEKARLENLRPIIDEQIKKYQELEIAAQRAGLSGLVAGLDGLETGSTISNIEAAIKRIEGIGVKPLSTPNDGGGGGEDKQADALKDLKEEFDNIIDAMEHKLEMDKRNGASIQDQIKGYKGLQAELHRQAEEYRKMGLDDNSEYIRALQKQWWDYQDDIDNLRKEEYEKQKEYNENLIDALKMYADEQKAALDDQIAALEEQLDLLDDQNDERERAIELEEAEQALLDARKQKIKVYREGVGWVYEADPRKVKEAEDKLQEIQDKNAQEDEKKAIEDKIEALQEEKDAWDKAYDEYQKYSDKMELELRLGESIEDALLNQKLDNWKDYRDGLKKIADDIIAAQRGINDIENKGSGVGASSSGGGGSVPKGGFVKTQAEADSLRAQMAANSAAWHKATTQKEKDELHKKNQELGARLGASYTSSTGKWSFANGTTGMPQTHLAMVGERGAELGVFPKGTGIIPHNLTENLMEIGKYSLSQLGNIIGKSNSQNVDKSQHITIQKVEVKANDANTFVKQLQNFVPISG